MKRIAAALALSLLATFSRAAAGPAGVLRVFVTAAPVQEAEKVDDATKQQLKAKREVARQARKDLEKKMKEQYGKKRETWPKEKDEELFRLEEAEAVAGAAFEYRKVDPKGMKDSVQNIVKSLQGKGMVGRKDHVEVASSAGEADLLVTVLARRAEKTLPTDFKPSNCYVLFSIGPAGEMKPARFARVPASYRFRKASVWAWKIRSPRPKEPFFQFEARNPLVSEFGCHGSAGNAASEVIDKFVEDNYATLTGR